MNKAQLIEAINAKGLAGLKVDKSASVEELTATLDALNASPDGAKFTEAVEATVKSIVDDSSAETAQEIEDLKAHVKAREEAIAEKDTEIEALTGQVEELTEALAKAEEKAVKAPSGLVVEVGKKKFQVISGGNIKVGDTYQVFSKEEIAADENLVAELAKKGSGLIKELEG